MIQNKYVVMGGSLLTVVLLAGTCWWGWQSQKPKSHTTTVNQSGDVTMTNPNLNASSSMQSVPLGGSSASESSSGLSVSADGNTNSMGQFTPNGSTGQATSQSGARSSSSSPFDPATFAQYEKYKDGNSALFAEVQAGTGAELVANKKAAVYYKGWLTNGQLFDQSRPDSKGELQPFVFTLGANQVIPGWEQAIAGMKVGGTRMMIIPPAVGYGAQGQGGIPPNSVLIFQVQLLAIE